MMDGKPMPEAIKGLFQQDSDTDSSYKFVKVFETRPNVIIYHSHVDPAEEKGKRLVGNKH